MRSAILRFVLPKVLEWSTQNHISLRERIDVSMREDGDTVSSVCDTRAVCEIRAILSPFGLARVEWEIGSLRRL